MSKGGIPVGQWSGSDAVEALHETTKTFNETTEKQRPKVSHLLARRT